MPQQHSILIIDDDPVLPYVVQDTLLVRGLDVTLISIVRQIDTGRLVGWNPLTQRESIVDLGAYALYLIDMHLHESVCNGGEILRVVREINSQALVGSISSDASSRSRMLAGGADFGVEKGRLWDVFSQGLKWLDCYYLGERVKAVGSVDRFNHIITKP